MDKYFNSLIHTKKHTLSEMPNFVSPTTNYISEEEMKEYIESIKIIDGGTASEEEGEINNE